MEKKEDWYQVWKKENRFFSIFLILGVTFVIIIIGIIFSIIFRVLEKERTYLSIDMGVSFVVFLLGFFWNVLYIVFFRRRLEKERIILITIGLGCCFFLIGFSLEFFFMYDNIVFP